VEIAAVIVLDHGLPVGACRAPITANFRRWAGWWSTRAPIRREAVGHMHLNRAGISMSAWLSRLQCALMMA
jgi:hypothetical protein